ncbi:MAG TPA: hypothetical protein VMT95_04410 [Candidatus Binatia bacterium]|nr:hypothetical protein [Candidatus Binatia bacterium]
MMSLGLFRNVSIASAAATSAVLFLAACSSSGLQRGESALPTAAVPQALLDWGQTGGIRPDSVSTKDLFVGEFVSSAKSLIQIYQNGTFKKLGQIKQGISSPDGLWVDSHGLYVANNLARSITQYSYLTSMPFTYKAGMSSPIAVTTDRLGDIFEADYTGYINEYYQQANFVVKKCSVVAAPTGVATGTTGEVVFAAYYSGNVGHIVEFTDFDACKHKVLGVRLGQTGAMAVDKHDDIILTQPYNRAVDIIKPPYNTVSGHLGSHWGFPSDVKINAANTRAWVLDSDTGDVVEVDYPSGKVVGTLVAYAESVVDGSNYVP